MADGHLDNQVNDSPANPHPNPNQKKGRHRLSLTLTLTLKPNPNQVKDRHRLTFLDPVTGTAVPCGTDGQVPWPPPLPTLPASKPPRRPSSSLANACTLKPPAGPHSHHPRRTYRHHLGATSNLNSITLTLTFTLTVRRTLNPDPQS